MHFLKFVSRELTLVIHGYDQRMSKVDLHLDGNQSRRKKISGTYLDLEFQLRPGHRSICIYQNCKNN